MKISSQARYGLRALFYLASKKDFCSTKKIGKKEAISEKYLEKILLKLEKAKIVKAKRGIRGGFKINKKLENIKIKKILQILDPGFMDIVCYSNFRKKHCPRQKNCSSQKLWLKIYQALEETLSHLSLNDLL